MPWHKTVFRLSGSRRDDAAQRGGGLQPYGAVLWEPDSGVLAADECLAALLADGGFRFQVECGAVVTAIDAAGGGGGGSAVSTSNGRVFRADAVVVCAGPASLGLAGVGTADLSSAPSIPQVAYFRSGPSAPGAVREIPVFIEWGEGMVYGLPVHGGSGVHKGAFKVSAHAPGTALPHYDPSDPTVLEDDPELVGALVDAVRRMAPLLDPVPVATERCIYDNSADTDFVLDRRGDVVVGCATSGHGFKFGPLLGEVLADLVDGSAPRIDLGPFRLARGVDASGR